MPIRAQADGHIWTQCAVSIFASTHLRYHILYDTDYPSLMPCCWLNYDTNHFRHTIFRLQLQGMDVTTYISFQCSSLFNDGQSKVCDRTSKVSVHVGHLWFVCQIIGLIWMLTKKLSKSLPKQAELLPPSYLTVMIENLPYFILKQEYLIPFCIIDRHYLEQYFMFCFSLLNGESC